MDVPHVVRAYARKVSSTERPGVDALSSAYPCLASSGRVGDPPSGGAVVKIVFAEHYTVEACIETVVRPALRVWMARVRGDGPGHGDGSGASPVTVVVCGPALTGLEAAWVRLTASELGLAVRVRLCLDYSGLKAPFSGGHVYVEMDKLRNTVMRCTTVRIGDPNADAAVPTAPWASEGGDGKTPVNESGTRDAVPDPLGADILGRCDVIHEDASVLCPRPARVSEASVPCVVDTVASAGLGASKEYTLVDFLRMFDEIEISGAEALLVAHGVLAIPPILRAPGVWDQGRMKTLWINLKVVGSPCYVFRPLLCIIAAAGSVVEIKVSNPGSVPWRVWDRFTCILSGKSNAEDEDEDDLGTKDNDDSGLD
jgi:hypothetical protein